MAERRKLFAAAIAAAAAMLIVTVAALALIISSDGDDDLRYPDITPEEYLAVSGLRPQITTEDLAALIDPQNRYVQEIAACMSSPEDVLAFVKGHIASGKDIDVYGISEHWASPTETLFNRRGDCEDSAILIASILEAMGGRTEIVIIDAKPSGHMAVLIDGLYIDQFAVHGQPPVNEDLVASVIGIRTGQDGKTEQRIIDKTEIFR